MLFNYLKVALRHIKRQTFYSFINIFGLAVGMACVLLIALWVRDEFRFDRHHANADRIHRIIFSYEYQGEHHESATTPWPLKSALLNDFPEIEQIARVERSGYYIRHNNNRFYETVYLADPEIFDIFSFPLIAGDRATALTEPYSLLLSETMSEKYFGSENPLGRTIQFENGKAYTVTGIFQDIPPQSHLRFDFLISFHSGWEKYYGDQWGMSNFWHYCLVSDDFNFAGFERRMGEFVEKYRGRESRTTYKIRYGLQPLTSIHLFSHIQNEVGPNGSLTTIVLFFAAGIFILLIACFNTINLSTARFSLRTQEVGLRKVLGANRSQIIKQFLGEALFLSTLAMTVSLGLAALILPFFNQLSGKSLLLKHLFAGPILIAAPLLILIVSLGSGAYPAFFLSSRLPLTVLRGTQKTGSRGGLLRKILIVAQFTIGIAFIAGTLIINKQLQFARSMDLGLNRKGIITIPLYDEDALARLDVMRSELTGYADIQSTSASNFFPGNIIYYQSIRFEGMEEGTNPMMHWLSVDENFIDCFGLEILQGRNFDRNFPTDLRSGYILNEAAVREIGWDDPIGKRLQVGEEGTVIGVVKDFHFKSLHREIEPLILAVYPELFQSLAVHLQGNNLNRTIGFIKDRMTQHAPAQVFSFAFLDDQFNTLYRTEMRLGSIFSTVAVLSVLIACLGLLGLSALTAASRTKEIGIRKVLGAPVSRILLILSGEYLILLAISNLIALPLAVYMMRGWLQNFAFRTHIGVGVLLLSAAAAFVISLATVGILSLKAAAANPVDSLRHE